MIKYQHVRVYNMHIGTYEVSSLSTILIYLVSRILIIIMFVFFFFFIMPAKNMICSVCTYFITLHYSSHWIKNVWININRVIKLFKKSYYSTGSTKRLRAYSLNAFVEFMYSYSYACAYIHFIHVGMYTHNTYTYK